MRKLGLVFWQWCAKMGISCKDYVGQGPFAGSPGAIGILEK